MIDDNEISHTLASQRLFPEMIKKPNENPKNIAKKNNWIQQFDEDNLSQIILNILNENPSEKERFKKGEKKLTGFFMGKIMKASKGTADPKKSAQLLNKLIS